MFDIDYEVDQIRTALETHVRIDILRDFELNQRIEHIDLVFDQMIAHTVAVKRLIGWINIIVVASAVNVLVTSLIISIK